MMPILHFLFFPYNTKLELEDGTIIWLIQKIRKIISKKSCLINGPIRPPAGRFGF